MSTTLENETAWRPAQLDAVVSSALGRPVAVAGWTADRVPYEPGSPATAYLFRLSGTTEDGERWRLFCKGVQHPRHWPMLHVVPPPLREDFLAHFPWRAELDAWRPGFADRLPGGLRVPRLHGVVDLGEDRLQVWMEDVAVTDTPWDEARFVRAARALGGLAALRSRPEDLLATGVPVGHGLRRYVGSRVEGMWPAVDDDRTWDCPLLAEDADLRRDLRALHDALPRLLDHLDGLPQSVPHGDASPQNLLQPADEPEVLVAIDVSFPSPCPVGFDLGQLLVGLVHAGQLPADRLGEVDALLVPAYVAGARAHGRDLDPQDVLDGHHGALVGRSAFTSLPLERLGEPSSPALRELVAQRLRLTRYIVGAGLALTARTGG